MLYGTSVIYYHCLQDRGDSPLSSAAVFTVKVLDVNDNPPVFSQVEYDGQINENATQVPKF